MLNLDKLNKITNKPPEINKPSKVLLTIGDEVDVKLEKSDKNSKDAITRSCGPIIVVNDAADSIGRTERVVITRLSKNGRTLIAKLSSPNGEPPTVTAEDPPKTPPAP